MTQVRSAKSVRSSTESDYQCVTQANISNARSNVRKHTSMRTKLAVGGTDNLIRAAFGMDSQPMCVVVTNDDDVRYTNEVGPNVSNKYRGYNYTGAGVRRSDCTVQHSGHAFASCAGMSWDYIVRRCDKLDMTLTEYCEAHNFNPTEFAALIP